MVVNDLCSCDNFFGQLRLWLSLTSREFVYNAIGNVVHKLSRSQTQPKT